MIDPDAIDWRKLLSTILRDAIYVLCDGGGSAFERGTVREEARAWVLDAESRDLFSFYGVCVVLDLEPTTVRDTIMRRALPPVSLDSACWRVARDKRIAVDVEAACSLVAQGLPLREVASRLRCSVSRISVLTGGARHKLIQEKQSRVRARYREGASVQTLMREFNLSSTHVYRILRIGRYTPKRCA